MCAVRIDYAAGHPLSVNKQGNPQRRQGGKQTALADASGFHCVSTLAPTPLTLFNTTDKISAGGITMHTARSQQARKPAA